jgi:large subunit ribosomal protein L3
MPPALLGRKIGMTRLYDESGKNVPVTIIEAGPCLIAQVKTQQTDGYDAVQFAFEDVKARNSTMPVIGHDAKAGLSPKRFHREVRLTGEEVSGLEPGAKVGVEVFDGVKYVDVCGTSKGKGYAGVMKRWGFKGLSASHGTERKHRSPGSVGGRAANLGTGKPKKGIRMSGRMGNAQSVVRSLEVHASDKQKNLLLVRGPVPGPNKGLVLVRQAVRLSKTKTNQAANAEKES